MISTEELAKALDACTTLEALGILRDALNDYLSPEQQVLIFARMTNILQTGDGYGCEHFAEKGGKVKIVSI